MLLNKDEWGNTALERCLRIHQRPKGYELMFSMLSNFNHFCFTKMLIDQFQHIVGRDSNVILEFFDSLYMVPSIVSDGVSVLWPENQERQIFPSHTAYISESFLREGIFKEYYPERTDEDNKNVITGRTQSQSKKEQTHDVEPYQNLLKKRKRTAK